MTQHQAARYLGDMAQSIPKMCQTIGTVATRTTITKGKRKRIEQLAKDFSELGLRMVNLASELNVEG